MIIKILHAGFFLLISIPLCAQSYNTKIRIDSLLDLAWNLRSDGNTSQAYQLANIGFSISQREHYDKGSATALNYLGLIYRDSGLYEKAMSFLERSAALRLHLKDTLGAANVWGNIGILKRLQGQYDVSIAYLLRALEIQKRMNKTIGIANAYMNLANTYEHEGSLNKSIGYMQQCVAIYKTEKDTLKLAMSYHNLATKYLRMDSLEASLENANRGLSFYQYLEMDENEVQVNSIITDIYTRQGEFKKAEKNYQSIFGTIQKKEISKETLFALHLNYASFLNETQKPGEALASLKAAARLAGTGLGYEEKEALALNKANAYAQLGKLDSALFFQNEAVLWKDSMYNQNRAEAIARTETQYNTPEIRKQLSASIIENQRKAQQNYRLKGILAGAPFLMISILAYFWQKRRKDKIIAHQKEQIHFQEIEKVMKDMEIKTIAAMLEGQEGERDRIAKDLHESVGSMLSALNFKLQASINQTTENDKASSRLLNDAVDIVNKAYGEVRQISHNLTSGVLSKFGIVMALKELLEGINVEGSLKAEVYFHNFDDIRLDSKIESQVYRIVQELICNSLKYARASEITVELNRFEQEINLMYEDNGIGFDLQKIRKGMGLRNIEARINELNAFIDIDSQEGSGISVFIKIPLSNG